MKAMEKTNRAMAVLARLKKRYPEGFSAEKSQHRQAGDV